MFCTFVQEVEKDGIRFPSDLDTPYAVVQVLNQQPGKLRIKDIREAVVAKKNKDQTKMTRQMKVPHLCYSKCTWVI